MNETVVNSLLLKRWIYGIPASFWLKNSKIIEDVITKYKLNAVPQESLHGFSSPTLKAEEKAQLIVDKRPYSGGIRIPHLHSKGDVYLVDEKLWKEMSVTIVRDLQAKLSRVNSVSFEQVMELSEAVDSLG